MALLGAYRRWYHATCILCYIAMGSGAPRDLPTVDIPGQGSLRGKEVSTIRTQRIMAYLGIPYAQPPLGDLRFKAPVTEPLPSWDGVLNATQFESPCLQTEKDYKQQDLPFLNLLSELKFNISENCLYLNVFVPYGQVPSGGYPTIIWFHPGNFTTGNPAQWNPYTLVYRQRIIVVTFAWRLSIMGFLTTMDGEAPGNYGLQDQQAAMQWVKANIGYFDGDNNNICLMGYGTGAMSIAMHQTNGESKGLFNKIISMSGGAFLDAAAAKRPIEDKQLLDNLAENYGCNRMPTSDLITCLRRVDATNLVEFTSNINWRPIIDAGLSNSTNPFLPEHPRNFFERGDFYKVPTLTGYTHMEDVLSIDSLNNVQNENVTEEFVPQILTELVQKDMPQPPNATEVVCVYNHEHIMDSVLFFYGPSIPVKNADKARMLIADFFTEKYYGAATYLYATHASKGDTTTYVYRFDMKPNTIGVLGNIPEWVTVPHLFDLIYVWGIPYWVQLPEHEWDERDKRTADIIMSFWANFAKTSNPTESSNYPITWDPFTADSPGVLIIDRRFTMSDPDTLNYKAFEFWNVYYPKVVELATQCCNATDGAGGRHDLRNGRGGFIGVATAALSVALMAEYF